MASTTINASRIMQMIAHWLDTPVNGYLGSTYGAPVEELIQKPRNSALANAFLAKMKADLPILAAMPAGSVSIYFQDVTDRNDAKKLIIQVGDVTLTVDELRNVS
jgi:hypothetical protein